MPEAMPVQPQAWSRVTSRVEPYRADKEKARNTPLENSVIDIERAVALWGDAVLRLALCKTHNKSDAEDVAQTVFLKLCQRKTAFDSDEHQKAWLLRVTLTSTSDLKRDPWLSHRLAHEDATDTIERFTLASKAASFHDLQTNQAESTESYVTEAVASLPEKQRIAVHLYYFEEYPIKEIAHIMDENPSTVRSHLHRARASLKTLIGGYHV